MVSMQCQHMYIDFFFFVHVLIHKQFDFDRSCTVQSPIRFFVTVSIYEEKRSTEIRSHLRIQEILANCHLYNLQMVQHLQHHLHCQLQLHYRRRLMKHRHCFSHEFVSIFLYSWSVEWIFFVWLAHVFCFSRGTVYVIKVAKCQNGGFVFNLV